MPTPPAPTTAVFLLTVAAVALLFVRAVGRVAGSPAARPRWMLGAAAAMAAWLALTGAVAAAGLLRPGPLPPRLLLLAGLSVALTVALAASPLGRRLALGIAPAWLVGYQVFRVPVEWVLLSLAQAGVAPMQMTLEGRNWDVLTGLSAPLLAWLVLRGRAGPRAMLAWNVAGLALLLNVVTVALLSAPTPLRMFHGEPANTFVLELPYVWLPAVLVQAALLGHLLLFRALLQRRAPQGGLRPAA